MDRDATLFALFFIAFCALALFSLVAINKHEAQCEIDGGIVLDHYCVKKDVLVKPPEGNK